MTIDRFKNQRPVCVVVLSSPKAGSGANRDQVPRLVELLVEQGIECRMAGSPEQLCRMVAESSESHEVVVVAAGGDGTLSLAASEISLSAETAAVPLVPMPLGTENLLARQFGHTARAEAVVETIQHGAVYDLDMGMANGKPFLIMATCGFDAEVVRGMHLTRRGHIRKLSYFRPILRAMRKYKFPKITICIDDGEPIESCWAMVFNLPKYGGGLSIEPDAIGDDGLLDVIAFRGGSIPSGLKYVSGIWLKRHLGFRDVIRRRGKTIRLASEAGRIPFQLDGDYAGRLPLEIKTLERRVPLLVPKLD